MDERPEVAAGTGRRAASRCGAPSESASARMQILLVAQPFEVAASRGPPRGRPLMLCDLLRSPGPRAGSTSQVFRILPRSGMIGLDTRGRAPAWRSRRPSRPRPRNSSVSYGSCIVQSASLPGSAGPADDALAHDRFRGLAADAGHSRSRTARIVSPVSDVLVQPQRRSDP